MKGTVIGFEDHGTIVLMIVKEEGAERLHQVPFDHSPFRWMVEARGGVANVAGHEVVVDGGPFEQTVAFADDSLN